MMRAVVALAVVGLLATSAAAQSAGKPPKPAAKDAAKQAHASMLRDAELDRGILRIRAYLGAPDRPAVGILVAAKPLSGAALQARTDAQGLATISNLKPNARYTVQAVINNELYTTGELTMPADAGMIVSLSPTPPAAAGAGGGASAGDGRPPPTQMHGITRGQEGDKPGTLSVRVVRGRWEGNVTGLDVHLVGYHISGKITHVTAKTDGGGRAHFSKLDRSRNTAYYAFAVIARPNKDQAPLDAKPHEHYDRVTSRTIMLPPKVGGRMILAASGAKDPTGAFDNNTDSFGDPMWEPPKPGEVIVEVDGPGRGLQLELVRAGGKEVEALASVVATQRRPRNVSIGRTGAIPTKELPQGVAYVRVTRPEMLRSSARAPLEIPTAKLELIDASTNKPVEGGKRSGADTMYKGLKVGGIYTWKLEVFGRSFEGKPFEMVEGAGTYVPIPVNFDLTSKYQAVFKGIKGGNDAVYIVQSRKGGQLVQSRPFQVTPTKGAYSKLELGPRIRYAFTIGAELDDNQMIFQGNFILANVSWFPYRPKDGDYVFKLPRGFKGATVHGGMEAMVAVKHDKGFAWRGAVPPRGTQFRGAWILLVDDGAFRFDMDLPNGAIQSKVQLKQVEGMRVKLFGNVRGKTQQDGAGNKWFVVDNLTINPGQAIVFDVAGLPRPPSYKKYMRWAVGLLALSLLIVGLFGVFRAGRRESAGTSRTRLVDRRESLLEALVILEREHQSGEVNARDYDKKKRKLMSQLESVYEQLEQDKTRSAASAK